MIKVGLMENSTFEEKLKSLENTVRKLEENDLSLDQSKELEPSESS